MFRSPFAPVPAWQTLPSGRKESKVGESRLGNARLARMIDEIKSEVHNVLLGKTAAPPHAPQVLDAAHAIGQAWAAAVAHDACGARLARLNGSTCGTLNHA